jgi:CBS domain-containing protein
MASNTQRFLRAFRSIEQHLRKAAGEGRDLGMTDLISDASKRDRTIRHFVDELHKFRQLRNVLVHGDIDGHEIAEPSGPAVAEIERIRALLSRPPRVSSLQKREVLTASGTDPVGPVVRAMVDRSYSQVPVYDRKHFLGLLTLHTVARFLGEHLDKVVRELRESPVRDVLDCAECPDTHTFIPTNTTLTDVLHKFETSDRQGRRLDALLITKGGGPDEKLLGIITVWDLPRINERLSI